MNEAAIAETIEQLKKPALIYHGQEVQDPALAALITTPPPPKTHSYTPVHHIDVNDAILDTIQKMDLDICSSEYKVNKDANVALGMHTVCPKGYVRPEVPGPDDMSYRIAWRNSYDKSRTLVIGSGMNVWICSNTLIMGTEHSRSAKHTGALDQHFEHMVRLTVTDHTQKLEEIARRREMWGNTELQGDGLYKALGKLVFQHKIIGRSMVADFEDDMKEGPFKLENNGSTNLWNLYMNTTHALKKAHPAKYLNLQKQAYDGMRLLHFELCNN